MLGRGVWNGRNRCLNMCFIIRQPKFKIQITLIICLSFPNFNPLFYKMWLSHTHFRELMWRRNEMNVEHITRVAITRSKADFIQDNLVQHLTLFQALHILNKIKTFRATLQLMNKLTQILTVRIIILCWLWIMNSYSSSGSNIRTRAREWYSLLSLHLESFKW